MMWLGGLYSYTDRSSWWRSMRAYFKSRGVTNDRKIESLCFRWIKQKGYRLPNSALGELK